MSVRETLLYYMLPIVNISKCYISMLNKASASQRMRASDTFYTINERDSLLTKTKTSAGRHSCCISRTSKKIIYVPARRKMVFCSTALNFLIQATSVSLPFLAQSSLSRCVLSRYCTERFGISLIYGQFSRARARRNCFRLTSSYISHVRVPLSLAHWRARVRAFRSDVMRE